MKTFGCSMSLSRKSLFGVMALTALLVALGASSAMGAPKGEYAVFYDCPTSNAELAGCIAARTESGKITIGKQTVPIENTQTLQGGVGEEEVEFGPQKFFAAADGNTLSKTRQNVPGGLLGLINCKEITNAFERATCEFFFETGVTQVTATTELAAPASSIGLNQNFLLGEVGTALSLPVKIKLENTFLGNGCYIGSNSNPITLNLTTGATKPPPPNVAIKGKLGTVGTRAEDRILVVSNNSLVDNSFAVPGATGCGGFFSFLLDPIINGKLGLPSTAGHNTAILNGTLEETGIEAAREHE